MASKGGLRKKGTANLKALQKALKPRGYKGDKIDYLMESISSDERCREKHIRTGAHCHVPIAAHKDMHKAWHPKYEGNLIEWPVGKPQRDKGPKVNGLDLWMAEKRANEGKKLCGSKHHKNGLPCQVPVDEHGKNHRARNPEANYTQIVWQDK